MRESSGEAPGKSAGQGTARPREEDRDIDREGDAPVYSGSAIEPRPIENKPDLSWVVQETFRNQYAEKYGHRGRWSEPGHGRKAADLVDYFKELAESGGLEFNPDILMKGVRNSTARYLADDDEFVVKAFHTFDLFAARIDRYVGVQRQVKS